ncbi:MAG: hypothetical protein ACKOS8_12675 [Gemmataceae bacterium]
MRAIAAGRLALALGAGLVFNAPGFSQENEKDSEKGGKSAAKTSLFSFPWTKDKAGEKDHKDGEATNRKPSKGTESDMDAYEKLEIKATDRRAALQEQADLRLREEQDYFRRLEVCDRLMQEAIRNGDAEAQRRIEQQQDRIQEIYNSRTAFIRLPEGSRRDLAILQDKLPAQKSPVANNLLKSTNAQAKEGKSQTASLREGR